MKHLWVMFLFCVLTTVSAEDRTGKNSKKKEMAQTMAKGDYLKAPIIYLNVFQSPRENDQIIYVTVRPDSTFEIRRLSASKFKAALNGKPLHDGFKEAASDAELIEAVKGATISTSAVKSYDEVIKAIKRDVRFSEHEQMALPAEEALEKGRELGERRLGENDRSREACSGPRCGNVTGTERAQEASAFRR